MDYDLPDAALFTAMRARLGADVHDIYQMEGSRITGRARAFEPLLARYRAPRWRVPCTMGRPASATMSATESLPARGNESPPPRLDAGND